MVVTTASTNNGSIDLSAQDLQLLNCRAGDTVRTRPLNVKKNHA